MDLSIPNHWEKLGIQIGFGNPILEGNQFKLVISSQNNKEAKVFFLDITHSPVFVVDVDNIKDTVKKFEYLSKSNGGLDNLVWERTRNGGYHLFFFSEEKHHNILHKSFNGLYIDVIFKGRIFTSPSEWGGKKYQHGGKSIFSCSSITDLPALPEWIDNLLCRN
jgi:hypothetical protein